MISRVKISSQTWQYAMREHSNASNWMLESSCMPVHGLLNCSATPQLWRIDPQAAMPQQDSDLLPAAVQTLLTSCGNQRFAFHWHEQPHRLSCEQASRWAGKAWSDGWGICHLPRPSKVWVLLVVRPPGRQRDCRKKRQNAPKGQRP